MGNLELPLVFLLFLITSLTRPMTSSATQYVGQVRIYVDQLGVDTWTKAAGKSRTWQFRQEMNSTIYEVNQIYKSLERYNLNIRFHIDEIKFVGNILSTDYSGKIINKDSLTQFENSVASSYSNDNYDLAILFTGANLVKKNGEDTTNGYAYIAQVCTKFALGVVELRATFTDALTLAHEIGHIFGADHDGNESPRRCSSTSGHIMNAITKNDSPNHFYFSSCSANSIRTYLNTLGTNNCLSRWWRNQEIYGPRFGSLMTPDQLCQRRFGSSSYVARMPYKSYGDKVCVSLACMTKTVGTQFYWTYAATPQGINCGKNKQCVQGKCVRTDTGSSQVSDTCPFGDQPKIEGSLQMRCSQMTSSKCANWKATCCQSCNDPGTADEVCRSLEGSSSSMARRYYDKGYGDICSRLACLTSVKGTYFSWNYHKAPDGMKCGKNKRCSNGACVRHNMGDPNMSDSCPYGDQPWLGGQWQKTCSDYIRNNGCGGRGWKSTCCASCNDPGTADEICKRLVDNNSLLARRAYSKYGNQLCSKLACLTMTSGTTFNWRTFTAPDGMKCGKNRRCSQGKCLWTSTGDSSMSDWCPYGDQSWLGGNWQKSCKDYVRQNGCGGNGWKETCCSSC